MELGGGLSAVVSGGGSGLGAATARALAGRGVRVAVFDRDSERGQSVAEEIGGLFCAVDVTDENAIDAGLARAREAHGQERILVNCAGIVAGALTARRKRDTGEIVHHPLADFARVVNVNLAGTFNMAAKSAAGMIATDPVTADGGRGVIINTASVAGEDGQLGQAAYAASKAGVMGLTLPMARDLAREGIRVVSIMPGLFNTPMFDSLTDAVREALVANAPFPRRLGEPKEYAALAVHICENEMLNGTCIRLDGAVRLPIK